jgi:4,5-dihydroxyphthalate decarboxylase
VDAVMTAHPPQCFEDGDANIGRLFEDYRPVEKAYLKETGIFPIMHVIAIRQEIMDQFPWLAMNLFKAFEEAKRRSVIRTREVTASRLPIPWSYHDAEKAQAYFDGDYWPYGIDDNRVTLEAFLGFAHEQGVCQRLLKPEELFAEQVQECFKV